MAYNITYTETPEGYLIPNITVPEQKPIGKYGMLCRAYLKTHRKPFYSTLLMTGRLNDYLCDIDNQAQELRAILIPKYKSIYGVAESLKAADSQQWLKFMNTIEHQIDEIIIETIY